MPAANYNLAIEQGISFVRTIEVTSGPPFDLTPYRAVAQIRCKAVDTSIETADPPLAELACTISVPTSGVIVIALTKEQTASLPITERNDPLVWDLKLEPLDSGGLEFRLLVGTVLVVPTVTIE
jgi:hypothetical protein